MDKKLKVAEFLTSVTLVAGLGSSRMDPRKTCTIGAINLALTGLRRDDPLPCMSPSLTNFVIVLQDRMSNAARNSAEWKAIIPLLLDTRNQEDEIKKRINTFCSWLDLEGASAPIDAFNPSILIRQILGLEPLELRRPYTTTSSFGNLATTLFGELKYYSLTLTPKAQ
jgi:hypothetical protein